MRVLIIIISVLFITIFSVSGCRIRLAAETLELDMAADEPAYLDEGKEQAKSDTDKPGN